MSFRMSSNALFLKQLAQNADYIFCIDGGGSKTTLKVLDRNLEEIDLNPAECLQGTAQAGTTNPNVASLPEIKSHIHHLFKELKIGQGGLSFQDIQTKSVLIAGISGFNKNHANSIKEIFTDLGFAENSMAILSDLQLATLILQESGAILIAGTGSICMSKTSTREKIVGGYGYILGDEGSGFSIGKQALKKALRDEEELIDSAFVAELRKHFQVQNLKQVIELFYEGTIKTTEIAKLAPLVFEEAYNRENQTCQNIINAAARELGHLVDRALVGVEQPIPLYLLGGIFQSTHASKFIEQVQESRQSLLKTHYINISQSNIVAQVLKKLFGLQSLSIDEVPTNFRHRRRKSLI